MSQVLLIASLTVDSLKTCCAVAFNSVGSVVCIFYFACTAFLLPHWLFIFEPRASRINSRENEFPDHLLLRMLFVLLDCSRPNCNRFHRSDAIAVAGRIATR